MDFWEEFFWRIVWEDFFGEDFLGGIFWEEFFVYIALVKPAKLLSRFCLKEEGGRKDKNLDAKKCDASSSHLKSN